MENGEYQIEICGKICEVVPEESEDDHVQCKVPKIETDESGYLNDYTLTDLNIQTTLVTLEVDQTKEDIVSIRNDEVCDRSVSSACVMRLAT